MADETLHWHNGFHAALQIELQGESAHLEFYSEHELYQMPLRIDTLVIKNSDDTPIQKNIGKIFRKYNLIEYKSPDDYLSIDDFYKVYGYACLYQSDTDKVHTISMNDITITFVCSHYPRKMLKLLKEERKIEVRKVKNGIYYLINDPLPMQIILTTQLSVKENRWLGSLRKNLSADESTNQLIRDYNRHRQSVLYQSAMDLIMRANPKTMKEAKNMVCDAFKELFADEFKEQDEMLKVQYDLIKAQDKKLKEQEAQFKEQKDQFKEQEAQFKEQEAQFKEQEAQFKEQEAQFKEQEKKLRQASEDQKKACKKSETRLRFLIQRLISNNLIEDLKRISEDEEYLVQMYQRYGL